MMYTYYVCTYVETITYIVHIVLYVGGSEAMHSLNNNSHDL